MNIHEHQAKDLLKNYGATVSNGIVILSKDEISKKIRELKSKKFVVKALIHAGGRGKAGGVKIVTDPSKLEQEIINMFGKQLPEKQDIPFGTDPQAIDISLRGVIKEVNQKRIINESSTNI